jgi:hypothetical protein
MKAQGRIHNRSILRFNHKRGCAMIAVLLFCINSYGQLTGVSTEGSSTLGRKQFQLAVIYSALFPSDGVRMGKAINQVSVKGGIGVLDHLDLKFSYSKWLVIGTDLNQNVFQLVTKFSWDNHLFALYLPVGLICSKFKNVFDSYNSEFGKLWIVTPRLIVNLVRKNCFEICLVPYVEIITEKSNNPMVTGGVNMGLGYFLKNRKLAVGLEAGIDLRSLLFWYPWGNAGVTVSYFLGKDK